MVQRVGRFIIYIFKSWVKYLLLAATIIGTIQAVIPLAVPDNFISRGEDMNWWKEFLLFIFGPWPCYWWIIIFLAILVIALGKKAWELGGFSLELGLSITSKPLPNTAKRYVMFHIENRSPKKIEQLMVRLVNIENKSNMKWKPSELINRKDRFLWSAHELPRMGTKEIVPGYEVVADIMCMGDGLDFSVLTLQVSEHYLFLPPGDYKLSLEIIGVYEGKRFEIPGEFNFVYRGDLEIDSVHFAYIRDKNWQISKDINVNIMPTTTDENIDEMKKELEKWQKKHQKENTKKKKKKS